MTALGDVITLGREQEGYIEKASNEDLDSKTANKGTANYTKYSRDVDAVGLKGCQAQPWCGTFQFWLDLQTGGKDVALKRWNMTPSTYVGFNCFDTYDAFKGAGRVGSEPRIGALVIFTFSHAGRVLSTYVTNGQRYFDCLEGNTSADLNDRNGGMVKIKRRLWTDPTIKGFCYIDYDEKPVEQYPQWIQSGGIWYYREFEGVNAHGWRLINHHWYFFASDGAMQTGVITINHETFYLWETKDSLEGACCKTDERGVLKTWYID